MRFTLRILAARRIFSAFVFAALACPGVSNAADDKPAPTGDPAAPSASVMLAGSSDLLANAEYLLKLTSKKEQEQWPILKSYLEVFLIGVDSKLPTRIAVLFDQNADHSVWSVPVADF